MSNEQVMDIWYKYSEEVELIFTCKRQMKLCWGQLGGEL